MRISDWSSDVCSSDLRKERREALAPGIEVEVLTGDALTDAHWDAFFSFYMDTGARKCGTPYLTRAFFTQATRAMKDRSEERRVGKVCGSKCSSGWSP